MQGPNSEIESKSLDSPRPGDEVPVGGKSRSRVQRKRRLLHLLFDVGVYLKGLDGALEIMGGILFLSIGKAAMSHWVFWVTRGELAEDPSDWVANGLRHAVSHLSINTQHFAGIYLVFHGVIKVFLVVGLLRNRRWSFPVALALLVAFLGYQLFRLCTHFSWGLTALTVIDLAIIILIWNEYRQLIRGARQRGQN